MGPIVETAQGRVKGFAEPGGTLCFRGLPYAEPPVRELRFASPRPAKPWPGVREAERFGPVAPQAQMRLPLPGFDFGEASEDCLTLNVWTPAADAGRRPVLVWIHGGAFVLGAGSQSLYEGAPLARRGDAVVVTINYRLGALGFLFLEDALPELAGAAPNPGIQDQVAALRWVRENIAGFGGDPDNVTVFGESAGGMSVGTLLGVPAARGLFRRAIAQSGAAHNVHDRESATRVAAETLSHLGLDGPDAARKLREVPTEELTRAGSQISFQIALDSSRPGGGLLPFQPVVDGDWLPEPPLASVAAGAAAGVSLLTGSTRDEWKLFGMLDPDALTLDATGLEAKLAQRIPGVDAAELVRTYREAREGHAPVDPVSLFFAIETDRIFRVPGLRLAEAQCRHQAEVFVYRFDRPSPAFDGKLGACHAIELPYVFGTHDKPLMEHFLGSGDDIAVLADQTMDAWLGFARGGDPSHPDLPDAWPAYDTARRATLLLDAPCRRVLDPDAAERAFWDGIL